MNEKIINQKADCKTKLTKGFAPTDIKNPSFVMLTPVILPKQEIDELLLKSKK
tara:strand:+ start:925 stop:1083 length:159 start_codon:yes stop_codon:yes gene_type:complete